MNQIIIQARMGSTRLPGKVLMLLAGRPVINHVVERCQEVPDAEVLVATTTNTEDDALVDHVQSLGVALHRGHPTDVLGRFDAAAANDARRIMRITADCPFLDPDVIAAVLHRLDGSLAYVSNVHPPTFPDGLDVEAFTREALGQAAKEAVKTSDREHVTPFIWKRPTRFPAANVSAPDDHSALRWTLDVPDDLHYLERLATALPRGVHGWKDTLAAARKLGMPENKSEVRNAGYQGAQTKEAEA